ncbi:MAG: sigma 54-interacting transcriptional regulator, partial [Kofleriaceae bacterium]
MIVIDSVSSRRISVPPDGTLQIGRSKDAEIPITSEAASRNHARLILSHGKAQIADLGSHNGTLVNGDRIEGVVALFSGDVVTIGDTLLILRSVVTQPATPTPVEHEEMLRRIDQEIARATEYDRPFSVVVFRLEMPPTRVHAAVAHAVSSVRPMDLLCLSGGTLIALLPELDTQAGRTHAQAIIGAVGREARGGVASYPADGADTPTLLAAARSSASQAAPGEIASASSASIEHQIGDTLIVVADPTMIKTYDLIRRLARSDISVMVRGETGSGKENASAALHYWSPRASGPFVALNCAALPESLAESELFGYERGAFTDAKVAKPGVLERAHGGTLFLDEVGDLSMNLQAKLLRAIEVKRVTRLGETKEREIDVRVVAATNVDLEAAVTQNRFRQDLLFRLAGTTINIPALRHRRQEIPLLARKFTQLEARRLGRHHLELSEAALAELSRYEYPGNVRELKNAIDFACATAEGASIQAGDLPP